MVGLGMIISYVVLYFCISVLYKKDCFIWLGRLVYLVGKGKGKGKDKDRILGRLVYLVGKGKDKDRIY